MGIFIVYIGKIRPLSHFDRTKFKVSLDIKIISFKNMAHQVMFVIFHVNVIICQNFNFTTHLLHFC
jgi:hypothetical protein